MLVSSCFTTPWGIIEIEHDHQFIHTASFSIQATQSVVDDRSPFELWIEQSLLAYTHDPTIRFSLPLKPQGTAYQQRVWSELLVIPAGRVVTYGELACQLQSSPRAVGQACKSNPIVLFIPCHRVVAKTHWGGYMGDPSALRYKLGLLEHERCTTPFPHQTNCP